MVLLTSYNPFANQTVMAWSNFHFLTAPSSKNKAVKNKIKQHMAWSVLLDSAKYICFPLLSLLLLTAKLHLHQASASLFLSLSLSLSLSHLSWSKLKVLTTHVIFFSFFGINIKSWVPHPCNTVHIYLHLLVLFYLISFFLIAQLKASTFQSLTHYPDLVSL